MDPVYLALGALLLAGTGVDVLWTTLWVHGGAGPLTSRLTNAVWRAFGRLAGDRRRARTLAGPVILVTGIAVWTALLWVGWTLIFASAESALLDTRDAGPISWVERFYFTGYAIFTLGNGDFAPRDGAWQIVTVLATAGGMLFVTLIVTYVLSVLDAVTQKRAFASGLGTRSDELVRRSWVGSEFSGLELPLSRFSSQLNTLTANHKAYPVLHYFHTAKAEHAPPITIAVLDETLTFLQFGTPERAESPDRLVVHDARSSVEDYLETLEGAFIEPADRAPPALDLRPLREDGVPTVSDQAFAEAVDRLADRRRRLLGAVESDRREWPNREPE